MIHSVKHDNTCWVRFGMYGKDKCCGCHFESECEMEPEDNPYKPLRPAQSKRKTYGRSKQDRILTVLKEIKENQDTFTMSAITVRIGIDRREAAERVKMTGLCKRIQKGRGHRESVWTFL